MKSMSKNVFLVFPPPQGCSAPTASSAGGGVSAAASSPGCLEQGALLGPPAAPLPAGQTPARWVEFLFCEEKKIK